MRWQSRTQFVEVEADFLERDRLQAGHLFENGSVRVHAEIELARVRQAEVFERQLDVVTHGHDAEVPGISMEIDRLLTADGYVALDDAADRQWRQRFRDRGEAGETVAPRRLRRLHAREELQQRGVFVVAARDAAGVEARADPAFDGEVVAHNVVVSATDADARGHAIRDVAFDQVPAVAIVEVNAQRIRRVVDEIVADDVPVAGP